MPWKEVESIPKQTSQPKKGWVEVSEIPRQIPQYDTSEEGPIDYLARGAARTGAGLGQGILDLVEFVGNAPNAPEDQRRAVENFLAENMGREPAQELPEQGFRISEKARGALDEFTGGYTAPQTEGEKEWDDLSRVVGSAIPGGGAGLAQRMGLAALSHLGQNFTESLTGSENAGKIAAIGLPILTILATKGAKSVYNPLYKAAEKSIPTGARVNSRPIAQEVVSLRNSLKSSPYAAETKPVRTFLRDAERSLAANPRTSVKDLWNLKRYASRQAQEAGSRNFLTGKYPKPELRQGWLEAYKTINDQLGKYAKTNAEFAKYFYPAEEAFRASKLSAEGVKRYEEAMKAFGVSGKASRAILSSILKVPLFGKMAAELGVALSKRGIEAAKSPTLRRVYGQNVGRAARGGVLSSSLDEQSE